MCPRWGWDSGEGGGRGGEGWERGLLGDIYIL